jgi:hypothetical protein
MLVDNIIRDAVKDSDISIDSDVYPEIAAHLTGIGLNLAFLRVRIATPFVVCENSGWRNPALSEIGTLLEI